jgi:hypothetical protein
MVFNTMPAVFRSVQGTAPNLGDLRGIKFAV